MRIETITKFIAADDTEFASEAECRQYEEFILSVPRWIVSACGEFGVSVKGRRYFYYKGDGLPVEDTTSAWRFVEKREFNEVMRSVELQKMLNKIDSERIADANGRREDIIKGWAEQFDWNTPVPAVVLAT